MRVRGQQTQHQEVSVVQRQGAQLVTSDDATYAGDGGLISDDRSRAGRRRLRGWSRCTRSSFATCDRGNRLAQWRQDLALVADVHGDLLARVADLGAVLLAGRDLVAVGWRYAGDGIGTIAARSGGLD